MAQFSRILDTLTADGGDFIADVPDSWLQGRTLFGGLQGAIAVRAMRRVLPRELPLRVLQMTFMAPVPAGKVRARAAVLRAGRSATHVEARLFDGDVTAALVVGIFGAGRESRVRVAPPPPREASAEPFAMPRVPGLTPAFVQHFRNRYLGGGLPFTASRARHLSMEVSLVDDGPTVPEHLLAIADAPPPVALSHLDTHSFGSSMTWTLELLRAAVEDLPLSGYQVDAELAAGSDGYTSQAVTVYAPSGEAVALSHQSMVVFG